MDSPDSSGIALSVERGQATDEELAALTVVLLALRADREHSPERQAVAGSRWWRHADRYNAPLSWQ
ncbi:MULTISPECIES: acyl-CoA carboxylase subunit epsilon [unclassified Streptomyces]|uniref:acyl-CoA carboxylase subunit epsilon n=1 Tax=unclassified Streptomyces TaxID=2593676 RepID=UPI00225501F7|nr:MULTISPECIES: acyl-CoA carboxylase subunit epsilon [unclassified Streptomyces]MCX4870429.1 acyl-CoA carboxylase subunit epsilon [Streptomyces sp. NBC_00906]MCX4902094.1 acyl-CoA carboxylase subunit epsilon [Streptomyces sp. NBC_00892]